MIDGLSVAVFFINHNFEVVRLNKSALEFDNNNYRLKKFIYSQKQYIIQTFEGQFLLIEIIADITDEKKREEIFHRNEKLISLGNVVQSVTHSLWNSLTGMRLTIESLENLFYYFKEAKVKKPIIFLSYQVKEKFLKPILRTGRYFAVCYSDNAGGISEKIIKQIFDPFFTTKKKRKILVWGSPLSIRL